MRIRIRLWLAISLCATQALTSTNTWAAGSKLSGTGGVAQIEGAAGGGLVPWALIAGLGSADEFGGSAHFTQVTTNDTSLSSAGVALGVFDRVELSLARQVFELSGASDAIVVETVGAKLRLMGDAIFDARPWMPQLAVGLQYKRNRDFAVPAALGADDDAGVDFYLAATKIFLAGIIGRTTLVNVTARFTRAHQLGILGFGKNDSLRPEFSAALFVTDHFLVGVEYRFKPDRLPATSEDDFSDAFVAWFPNKFVALTAAYVHLGTVAGLPDQRGFYGSLQISF